MFTGKVLFLFDFILLIIVFLSVFCIPAQANPIGPVVVAGSASVQNTLSLTTVHQSSNATIINWQSFSINPGQTTQFLQPGSQSVALNRVLGGGRSILNGNLFSNGQVFLINQDGILVGPHGVIDASAFTASTQGLNDSDFLNGKLQFFGHSRAGVVNRGTINSSLGDVVLIGKTVDNRSQIRASNGTVGLIAGNNVLLGQKNADGTTITVDPSRLKESDLGKVGVENSGSVQSAAAELKAANGNIYSLAIQNTGVVRATSSKKQGGHIWLTSDTGTISNSGILNVSAKASGGEGGAIHLTNKAGTTVESGQIIAEGGQGGIGGNAEVSGKFVKYSGTVNLLAPGGTTGNLLFDPYDVTIETGTATGNSNFAAAQNDSVFYTVDLENALSGANVTVSTGTSGAQSGDITLANDLTWTQGTTLTLSAANNIYLNADITASSGGLTLNAGNNVASGNEGLSGSILSNVNVGSFILQNGSWVQDTNGGSLPTFTASNDFELQNSSSFLRVAGGNGSTGNPYQVTDVYGLQGVGSPGGTYLSSNVVLNNNVDATGTATWNGGSGFVPIGGHSDGTSINAYSSTFNGAGHTINGLTINRPTQNYIGLFGGTLAGAIIENVGLTGGFTAGQENTGGLVGLNEGTVEASHATGAVTGGATDVISGTGGLVGVNLGTVETSYATGAVSGTTNTGGLVAFNEGTVGTSYATGAVSGTTDTGGLVGANIGLGIVEMSYATGAVSGTTYTGGLVAFNEGTVETSYATGAVSGNGVTGGLVGSNQGIVEMSYATGAVSGITSIGGLVGLSDPGSKEETSYATGAVGGATDTGGLVGNSLGTVETSYASGAVSGTTDTGGLVGANVSGIVEMSYATGAVSGTTDTGGLVGSSQIGSVQTSYTTGAVSGTTFTGGLVGFNVGSTVNMSYSTGTVTAGSESSMTGGLVGFNLDSTVNMSYSTGTVTAGSESSMTGGLVGENEAGTVNTSYSTGAVIAGNGSVLTGGLVGENDNIVQGSYWAQDTGLNTGLEGIGNSGNVGASPETFAQLGQQNTFQPSGAGSTNWDFTLGTGVWGINGIGSSGLINNGLPYFQWQYATQAKIVPLSQTLVYSGTTGIPNQALGTAYNVNYAPTYNGSLSPFLASAPAFTVHGSNVNVVNSGAVNTITTALSVNPGYAVELANNVAAATYAPYTLTVTPIIGQSVEYGASSAHFAYGVGSALNGDVVTESGSLGGYTQYIDSVVNGPSYPIMLGSLVSNNTNYSIALASTPVSYTVAARPLIITPASGQSVQYGASSANLAYSVGSALNGDMVTESGSLGGYAQYIDSVANGPSHPIALGSLVSNNANYLATLASIPVSYVVTAKPLIITPSSGQSVQYGATGANFAYNVSGTLNDDVVTESGSLGGYTQYIDSVVNGPRYPITPGSLNSNNANYSITLASTPVNYLVTSKPVTLSAVPLTSPGTLYGNTPSFSNDGAAGQLVNGDSLQGTITYSTSDRTSGGGYLDAGTYSYAPVITGYNSNYSVATQSATFTINPATVTYVANPAVGFVGQNPTSLGGTLGGLLPNDTQSQATSGILTFSVAATSSSPAGYYPINGGGLSAFNYIFTQSSENSAAFYLIPTSNTPPPPIQMFDPAEHSQEYDKAFYHAYQHALLQVHAHAKKKAHMELHAKTLGSN